MTQKHRQTQTQLPSAEEHLRSHSPICFNLPKRFSAERQKHTATM